MEHAKALEPHPVVRRPKPDDAAYCAAPGCQRWSRTWGQFGSFLCGFHWMRLTKRERAAMRRVWRTCRLIGDGWWGNKPLRRREQRLWQACVRRASQP